MPTARREFGAVTVNGIYYAVGGLAAPDSYLATFEKYDAAINQWTTVTLPLPLARSAPAVAAYGSKIYVFGGSTALGPQTRVDVYDTATNKWTASGTTGAVPNMPTVRSYMAAAELNGKIYVVGGALSSGLQSRLVEVYDPATNAWTAKTGTGVAQLNTARSQLTVTSANGKLWAVGGPGSIGTTVEFFDPTSGATGTWYAGAANVSQLPTARSMHATGVMNGLLYVVGGLTTGSVVTDTVYVLDPLNPTGGWTIATPMPTARFAFGGSVGTVNSGSPPVTRFIAAGGSTQSQGAATNTVASGGGG